MESMSLEEALEWIPLAGHGTRIALIQAIASSEQRFLEMARWWFERVEEAGWTFGADGQWRRTVEPGPHRLPEDLAWFYKDLLFGRRDREMVREIERKAKQVVAEEERLRQMVRILYHHQGFLDRGGGVHLPDIR